MNTANQPVQKPVLLINNLPISNVSMDDALDLIEECIVKDKRQCIFFINAHCVNVSVRDKEYCRLLQREDTVLFGDGAGVRIAGYLARHRLQDNVNGTDMFPLLCERAVLQSRSFFLLGGKPGVPEAVAERMQSRYPGLLILGCHHGYFSESETESLIRAINASGADILLVALGVPNQEYWIAHHRARLTVPVAMGVGGLFDFYSGRIPRAPLMMRRMGIEWAWRLAMEPRRMWKRYVLGNLAFLGRVFLWTFRHP